MDGRIITTSGGRLHYLDSSANYIVGLPGLLGIFIRFVEQGGFGLCYPIEDSSALATVYSHL
jgi:hypothetical protein